MTDVCINGYEPPIYEKKATTYLLEKIPETWPGVRPAPFSLNRNEWVHTLVPGLMVYSVGKKSVRDAIADALAKHPALALKSPINRNLNTPASSNRYPYPQRVRNQRPQQRRTPQQQRNRADNSGDYIDTGETRQISLNVQTTVPGGATSAPVTVGYPHRIVDIAVSFGAGSEDPTTFESITVTNQSWGDVWAQSGADMSALQFASAYNNFRGGLTIPYDSSNYVLSIESTATGGGSEPATCSIIVSRLRKKTAAESAQDNYADPDDDLLTQLLLDQGIGEEQPLVLAGEPEPSDTATA